MELKVFVLLDLLTSRVDLYLYFKGTTGSSER